MVPVNKSDIQRMFNPIVYRRGREYYFQDRVGKLHFEHSNGTCWANVEGSHSYLVEIQLNKNPDHMAMFCDCKAYLRYDECKHIVAVMLKLCEKEAEVINMVGYTDNGKYFAVEELLESVGTAPAEPPVSSFGKPMKIEYHCDFSNPQALFIEIKAGVDHLYVVRNVSEFIENVKGGREHLFTPKFTYSPEEHVVSSADQEILYELLAMIENERLYADGIRYQYSSNAIYSTARSIMIPPLFAKSLLKKLTKRKTVSKLDNRSFSELKLLDEPLPFQFELDKNEKKELELFLPHMENAIFMKPYELVFMNGRIFYPAPNILPLIEKIFDIENKTNRVFIPSEKADAFASEVLPMLKKVGTVQVAEKVKEQIIQAPLTAKLYLDLEEDTIKARLEYHYGDFLVDPFQPQGQDGTILIRDVDKEQEIMTIMENAKMKYNGKELHLQLDEEELYDFIFTILPALGERCELYMTNSLRLLVMEEQPVPKTEVRTDESFGLLEISFQMDGVDQEEIAKIMETAIEKKRFYKLKSGAFLSLETDEFRSLQEMFTDLHIQSGEVAKGTLEVPIYRGMQLDETLRTKKQYDPSFRKLLDHLNNPEEQVFPLPEGLNASMREYQKTGYQWFRSLSHYHLGGILADDMGLGKTLQSIAYLLSVIEGNKHLIVAPASLIYNWQSEWEKFAPGVKTVVISGTPESREKMLNTEDAHIFITSYSTLRQDIQLYKDKQFHTLILDEAQFIKNYSTKAASAVREIRATRKFALSGTPIENSVDELWGIFQAILPGLFPGLKDFKKMEPKKIANMIRPFILRRLKSDVLKELPEKIESTHILELSKEQKELYVGYLQRIQQETAASLQEEGFQKSRMKILAGITRLRQLCCHPLLFLENFQGTSGKLEQLLEIVENSIANGKRLLIFSQFTSMLDIIQTELTKSGYPHFYLNGKTPSQERLRMSQQFNEGEKAIFLISLKAGGTGLNLTAADTVILYDLWWNPAVEDQAAGRAHRFGQKNVVQVIRLITKGTIEEKIYQLQQKKRELIEQVIQPGETMLSSLSEEDIKEILSM
ncbi:DEAD/DEAH box helicase [Siminovitchia sp. FSL H7-0308]|uniref:DEAD/DEAH box helicase n=1 Tax=unclassified Siminovitchia TaxID=2837530 RepID=UPI0030CD1FB2